MPELGFSVLRHFPPGHLRRARLRWSLALLTCLLAAGLVTSPAGSASGEDREDRLEGRRDNIGDRIGEQQQDLHEVSRQLVRAQARIDQGVADLANARAELADAEAAVVAAVELDRQMAERLAQAIIRLADARDDLRIGKQAVRDKRGELAGYAVAGSVASDAPLLDLGLSLAADSAGDALDELQISRSLLDKQSVVLQELQANEVLLTLTEERVEQAKVEVAEQRRAAAEHLDETRRLQAEARNARDSVSAHVASLRAERATIAALKQQELARLETLRADREEIQDTLIAIAQRRARQHNTSISTVTPKDAGGVLGWPIGGSTYITSSYGPRLHPILHIWKLHDGTDFSAPCGTPLYASAAGVVQSAYYNAGYGNRIILDHGIQRGVSLWSSVNHLSSFAVGPGERVQRGQLIGYSGTTGYSTGCHLHFMVYVNGYTVNPMGWL